MQTKDLMLDTNMPRFLEEKLKKEYPNEPSAPYKVMNKLGYMHGSKETAKGKKVEKKHEAKERALAKAKK
jgi:hypothetical protein